MKDKLLQFLFNEDFLIRPDLIILPNRKPNHGSCCTCQECGNPYEDCICDHNRRVKILKELFKEK